jgi:serine/threonine protein phosphatase PrpC
MSTHRFLPAKCKGKRLPFLFMLGGLLLLIPLLLPATALAAPRSASATPPLTKPQQIVNLAGVSVVRLSLSYLPAKGTTSTICTELGTIIASWPASSTTEKNTWVLTDGSLLTTSTKNSCAPGGKLASIQLLASNEFTSSHPELALLDSLTCTTVGSCSDAGGTQSILTLPASNAILFSFHTNAPLPYVAVERANTTGNPAPTSIELSASATTNSIPPSATKNVKANTLTQFLTPIANATAPGSAPATAGTISSQTTEPGLPFVDGNGEITGAQLLNATTLVTVSDIENLEGQIPTPAGTTLTQQLTTNTLSQEWDSGIIQYELGEYSQAIQTFSLIQDAPPAFKAPATFSALARSKLPKSGTSGSTNPSSHGEANSGSLSFWLIIIGLIAGVVVLVLLFVLVSVRFGRKRIQRKQELASFEADVNQARQRVEGKEKPVAVPQQYSPSPSLYGGTANYPPAAPPPASAMQPPQPAQLSPVQPPPVSISDIPTTEIPNKNGSLSPEEERTMPFSVQQLQGRNLGLAVITATDPGIKRKHKPNEDSVFAAQGVRTHNSQPQQFGLFVVADGMGGHANGQDASRTAIQNIIDFMLPRLAAGDDLNDEGYKALLVEGVQQANLAVHQRNLQDHADMGTTMTAALVVGATAYVANVGDSRTYLYREPGGLQQITHDHSVVASLVEAGIIKPDDIYTHPKRNQIYRSLGEKPGVEIDSFIQPLLPNDKLLLCSDGLWDMVRDPDIQQVVRSSIPNLNEIGKNLVRAALDGGGEDNVSVIVVSITEEAGQPTMTGIHLHARPDTVTVPDMPNI